MSVYALTDIETDDGGEISFSNGDLKMATVSRSHTQALNWLIMTNRSEVLWPDSVANIGSFQGSLNIPRTHRAVEAAVRRAVMFQNLFSPDDLDVRMTAVSIEDAALTVRITGIFVETDSDVVQDPTQATHVLAYLYPFNNEVPRRVV
jgi:hypothetical protein